MPQSPSIIMDLIPTPLRPRPHILIPLFIPPTPEIVHHGPIARSVPTSQHAEIDIGLRVRVESSGFCLPRLLVCRSRLVVDEDGVPETPGRGVRVLWVRLAVETTDEDVGAFACDENLQTVVACAWAWAVLGPYESFLGGHVVGSCGMIEWSCSFGRCADAKKTEVWAMGKDEEAKEESKAFLYIIPLLQKTFGVVLSVSLYPQGNQFIRHQIPVLAKHEATMAFMSIFSLLSKQKSELSDA